MRIMIFSKTGGSLLVSNDCKHHQNAGDILLL